MDAPRSKRISIEDLRPDSLHGIVDEENAVARLDRIARAVVAGRLLPPNLLFHGPPGVGKTTADRAFARAILGEQWEHSFHQLDASDDRSLDVIRSQIVPQTRTAPSRNAPVRIFFFDDADALGEEEQEALRPAMEGGRWNDGRDPRWQSTGGDRRAAPVAFDRARILLGDPARDTARARRGASQDAVPARRVDLGIDRGAVPGLTEGSDPPPPRGRGPRLPRVRGDPRLSYVRRVSPGAASTSTRPTRARAAPTTTPTTKSAPRFSGNA